MLYFHSSFSSFPCNCGFLCICVLLLWSVDLATGPALLSLHGNKLNSMELCCRYGQEHMNSPNNF